MSIPLTIAFMPLRSGSKSIPNKNIKSLAGHPLCYYALKACQDCPEIDKVVVAIDSKEYESVIKQFQMPKIEFFKRSEESATDEASTEKVIFEYLDSEPSLDPDTRFFLIQATNPYLKAKDLSGALNLLKGDFDSLLSVAPFHRFQWNQKGEPLNYSPKQRPRRQDFEGSLVENGSFYLSSVSQVIKNQNRISGKIGLYEMPEYSMHDIDEPTDWIIAEALLQNLETNSR